MVMDGCLWLSGWYLYTISYGYLTANCWLTDHWLAVNWWLLDGQPMVSQWLMMGTSACSWKRDGRDDVDHEPAKLINNMPDFSCDDIPHWWETRTNRNSPYIRYTWGMFSTSWNWSGQLWRPKLSTQLWRERERERAWKPCQEEKVPVAKPSLFKLRQGGGGFDPWSVIVCDGEPLS